MLRKTRQRARERIPVQHCSHGSSYRYCHLGMALSDDDRNFGVQMEYGQNGIRRMA